MSNSKDNSKVVSKSTSFNKSKSISKAIDSLEKEKSFSNSDLENDMYSFENVSSDDSDEVIIENRVSFSEDDEVDNIMRYDEDLNPNLDKQDYFSDDGVILSKPRKKVESLNESYSKNSKSFKNSKFKINLSIKSKLCALIGVVLGISIIIYGINNFSNVSDRVIDHAFLGETGSWSIIMIFIGLIIILLTIFFVIFYKNALNDDIKNTQLKNTFDAINQIKNIDSSFYEKESNEKSESIFKSILKMDSDEIMDESSENKFNTTDFFEDEIISVHEDNNENNSSGDIEIMSGMEDISDSNNSVDSLDVLENIELSSADLNNDSSGSIRELIYNSKHSKKHNYDDLSSFLEDDEGIFDGISDNDGAVEKPKTLSKSNNLEDLATKKARIIEGTNFDNSLRKSKK